MPKKTKKHIFPQMFDVRPVDGTGNLDLEKINSLKKVVKVDFVNRPQVVKKKLHDVFFAPKPAPKIEQEMPAPSFIEEEAERFRQVVEKIRQERLRNDFHPELSKMHLKPLFPEDRPADNVIEEGLNEEKDAEDTRYFQKFTGPAPKAKKKRTRKEKYSDPTDVPTTSWKTVFPSFAVTSFAVILLVFSLVFVNKGLKIKGLAIEGGQEAYANLLSAKDGLVRRDFQKASFEFNQAYERFNEISNNVNDLGEVVVASSKYIPFTSKLSSGAHLAAAGKDISEIGLNISKTLETINRVKNAVGNSDERSSLSFLQIFQETDNNLKETSSLLGDLEKNLDGVNMDDIPEEQRGKFVELKKNLPQINETLAEFLDDSKVFTDILGGNGPRKYLFLFQNNQEMRATGGFIGTYGVLSMFNGRVEKFFVDGIFNPDGQLREKVIPPTPIQKISAAWSLHDSNWFPDFPTSAEKASWFYEKTGGPTVDGVITMTPTVMQKLLEITGPIEMPEYGVTVDKDNFIEKVQYEVEVDYDKELNQPKKILADLAPKILDKILNGQNFEDSAKVMQIMMDSLNEKHILIYSKNYDIEKILSERGWSGEILNTQKDYLSVVNTNINGYKTDGVIDERIEHEAQIQPDGSVVDTVTITRHHNGGDTAYEWWNKVNADYMRVYVPKGSQFISATGQTKEFDSPPLDYKALGFKTDAQVAMEENQTKVDDQSGTRIYEDAGKAVFANWIYVSPKETVEIKYTYLLPFKIDTNLNTKPADTYSLLVQKQSGSIGSAFTSHIIYPDFYDAIWRYPSEKTNDASGLADGKKEITMDDTLKTDKFVGVAFTKN